MNTLEKLQRWYRHQCDGDWEHGYGVVIETLDNPGWGVKIDLTGTTLQDREFTEVSSGVGEGSSNDDDDWMRCWVEEDVFQGVGGPAKLRKILEVFLAWSQADGTV